MHKNRPSYNDLVEFMVSGPVVVQVLEGEDAVAKENDPVAIACDNLGSLMEHRE